MENALNSGGKSPASIGGEFVTNLTQWRETNPTELNDAHACGMEGVAFQATRTRRSGSHCEP